VTEKKTASWCWALE